MPISDAVRTLDRDLRDIFGDRLESLVAYTAHAPGVSAASTLAVIADLSTADLRACAAKVAEWRERGLSTPLVLASREFERSLDAFPFEFGAILAAHTVVSGRDPFEGLRIDASDLRHACEVQARGLLIHLREGFIETEGRSDRLADLIMRSAATLGPLAVNVAGLLGTGATTAAAAAADIDRRLDANTALAEIVSSSGGQPLTPDAARRIFPGYLAAVERLTTLVDGWKA